MRLCKATVHYGSDRRQVADLWLPSAATAAVPVVVLVHGGFWRAPYTKRLMNRLAADVVRQGWAAWNVEYRRVGRFGGGGSWSVSANDVADAIAHLADVERVDPGRVAVCGHSAGAQLAACALTLAASRPAVVPTTAAPGPVQVRSLVSLAGVLDLVEAEGRRLGRDAVRSFVGGTPDTVPDRYVAASPLALVPLGVEQLVVHGENDSVVPYAMSERYAKAAEAGGDRVTFEVVPDHGHLALIDPGRPAWQVTVRHLVGALAP